MSVNQSFEENFPRLTKMGQAVAVLATVVLIFNIGSYGFSEMRTFYADILFAPHFIGLRAAMGVIVHAIFMMMGGIALMLIFMEVAKSWGLTEFNEALQEWVEQRSPWRHIPALFELTKDLGIALTALTFIYGLLGGGYVIVFLLLVIVAAIFVAKYAPRQTKEDEEEPEQDATEEDFEEDEPEEDPTADELPEEPTGESDNPAANAFVLRLVRDMDDPDKNFDE